MAKPCQAHWNVVLHILKYLQGTLTYGIAYQRTLTAPYLTGSSHTSPAIKLEAFSYADWAACKSFRRSTGSYLFKLAEGAITWSSKRQAMVSLSTIEAEYRSLADAAREAVYLQRMLNKLRLSVKRQVPLHYSDKQIMADISQAVVPTCIDI